jgi:hypothetical protein
MSWAATVAARAPRMRTDFILKMDGWCSSGQREIEVGVDERAIGLMGLWHKERGGKREREEVEEEMDSCLCFGEEKCKKGEKGKCKQIRLALGQYILLPLPYFRDRNLKSVQSQIQRSPKSPQTTRKWWSRLNLR